MSKESQKPSQKPQRESEIAIANVDTIEESAPMEMQKEVLIELPADSVAP